MIVPPCCTVAQIRKKLQTMVWQGIIVDDTQKLQAILKAFSLRRKKEILVLPKKNEHTLLIPMTTLQLASEIIARYRYNSWNGQELILRPDPRCHY